MNESRRMLNPHGMSYFARNDIWAVALTLMLVSCAPREVHGPLNPTHSLYNRLGGQESIDRITAKWIDAARSDKELEFDSISARAGWEPTSENVDALQRRLANYLYIAAGSTSQVWYGPSLQVVHREMRITPSEFKRYLEILADVLAEQSVPTREANDLLNRIETIRAAIVASSEP